MDHEEGKKLNDQAASILNRAHAELKELGDFDITLVASCQSERGTHTAGIVESSPGGIVRNISSILESVRGEEGPAKASLLVLDVLRVFSSAVFTEDKEGEEGKSDGN